MKREATYLENLFIKDTFDQSIQRTIKTTNNLIKKWRKTLNFVHRTDYTDGK